MIDVRRRPPRRRLRRYLGGVWTATLAAGFVACNSISGLDQDFSLSQTTPSPSEGGVGPDGQPVDPDGAGGDGSTTPDGPITNQPCPSPRPAGMLFCDDFEGSGASPLFGWDRRENKGGVPEVDGNVGNANTRGLRARASTGAACTGNSCAVVLWKNVGGQFPRQTTIKLTFQFRVTAATIDYAVMGAIQIAGAGGGFEYGVAVYKNVACPGGNACLDENQPTGTHNFANAVPLTLNTWHQAEVVVTRNNGSNYEGRVILDGVTSLDTRAEAFSWSSGPIEPNIVEVGTGAFFTGNNGTNVTETNIDNVVVTKTPP